MNNLGLGLIVFFLSLNLLAFFLMFIDKINSRHPDSQRISEGMMFFLAASFGSVGVYLGMFVFRHKTKTWYFLIGIPLLIIENCALLYVVYLLVEQFF